MLDIEQLPRGKFRDRVHIELGDQIIPRADRHMPHPGPHPHEPRLGEFCFVCHRESRFCQNMVLTISVAKQMPELDGLKLFGCDARLFAARIALTSGAMTRAGINSSDQFPVAERHGESVVIWTLWLTYGAFYFCRTNISAAVPGLKGSVEAGGLGLSAAEVGWILASLKIAYGVGQFVNGQLSERISPRVMLTLGMFGSAALNVLFGLGNGFYFLLFVWASNGFCQSLGWTPCIRVVANWIPVAG